MLLSAVLMDAEALYDSSPPVADAENWLALGAGGFLLVAGARQPKRTGGVRTQLS